MYDHQIHEDFFFMMLYGAVTMLALTACLYLLFRRSNAIAPDVVSSIRLRRWTAAFFASIALSHMWYTPILFLTSNEEILLSYLVGSVLDFMTVIPSAIIVLLVMLQDRQRPLWSAAVMVAPLVVGTAWSAAIRSEALLHISYAYYMFLGVAFMIYMVCEVRKYGRWLRDNYADLEHKEVWQSFVVLAIILLVFVIYAFGAKSMAFHYIVQLNDMALICYLLWRVETLSDLSISQPQNLPADLNIPVKQENDISQKELTDKIGTLLQQHCIDTQLYLQHDLTILQLAKVVGTNRLYLSQYFSSLGMNYNAYINNLRINHFISLYHEDAAAQSSATAQQLAFESGYRSYNTFRDAFKRKMGQSVTAWMKEQVSA